MEILFLIPVFVFCYAIYVHLLYGEKQKLFRELQEIENKINKIGQG